MLRWSLLVVSFCILVIVMEVSGGCTLESHIDSEKSFCRYKDFRKLRVGKVKAYFNSECQICTCTDNGLQCCGIGWKSDDVTERKGFDLVKLRRCNYKYVAVVTEDLSDSLIDTGDGSMLIAPEDDLLFSESFFPSK